MSNLLEYGVLKGFGDMLVPDKVPVVQLEYGAINIVTKFLLRDFYQFFESRGIRSANCSKRPCGSGNIVTRTRIS